METLLRLSAKAKGKKRPQPDGAKWLEKKWGNMYKNTYKRRPKKLNYLLAKANEPGVAGKGVQEGPQVHVGRSTKKK